MWRLTGRRRKCAADGERGISRVAADITGSANLAALRGHVASTYGKADMLFAEAGIASSAPLAEVMEEEFDWTVAATLTGTFFTVQTLLPVLRFRLRH